MLIYDFSDNCVYLNIYVNLFDKTFETNFIDLYRVPVK